MGVILKWLHAKCSGIDGFKFRPQWPQNDKVRGRRGVRKPLFLEIPIIWLFKSTGVRSPPTPTPRLSYCTERSAHHHPINHMCAGPKYSWARKRSWKWCSRPRTHVFNYTMQHGNSACRRRVKQGCQKVLSHRTKKKCPFFFFLSSFFLTGTVV